MLVLHHYLANFLKKNPLSCVFGNLFFSCLTILSFVLNSTICISFFVYYPSNCLHVYLFIVIFCYFSWSLMHRKERSIFLSVLFFSSVTCFISGQLYIMYVILIFYNCRIVLFCFLYQFYFWSCTLFCDMQSVHLLFFIGSFSLFILWLLWRFLLNMKICLLHQIFIHYFWVS